MRALAGLTNYERTRADGPRAFDLSRPKRLLAALGGPDRMLGQRVLQVSGTKGKGSVARFCASILRAAGLRTGLFVSPHLERVEERIQVGGECISGRDFAASVERVLCAVETQRLQTTFFEATLAAACLHFSERETEAVVLEVGMGGRLDATTAVPVTHTLVAELSVDHTEVLGATVPEIAREKAGILRPGVPVWSASDPQSEAGRVVFARAQELGAPFHYVPEPAATPLGTEGLDVNGLRIAVLGRHQAHNAALAAAACADLGPEMVRQGLQAARIPGCCEWFPGPPDVLLDGAHNRSSIAATLRTVAEHFPGRRVHLLFALACDKETDALCALLAPAVEHVVCTRTESPRAWDPAALADRPAWQGRARAEPDPEQALARLRETAEPEDLILVTGSLYLAGAVRRGLRNG